MYVYIFIYPISPPICIYVYIYIIHICGSGAKENLYSTLKFVDKIFIEGAMLEKDLKYALFKNLKQIFIFEYFRQK